MLTEEKERIKLLMLKGEGWGQITRVEREKKKRQIKERQLKENEFILISRSFF